MLYLYGVSKTSRFIKSYKTMAIAQRGRDGQETLFHKYKILVMLIEQTVQSIIKHHFHNTYCWQYIIVMFKTFEC